MKKLFTIAGIFLLSVTALAQTTYKIGDRAQGGIVFWVDETGQHGLVSAMEASTETVVWSPSTSVHSDLRAIPVLTSKDGIYAGKENTIMFHGLIKLFEVTQSVALEDSNASHAFKTCEEMQVPQNRTSYGDWYLPSMKELDLLLENMEALLDSGKLSEAEILKINPQDGNGIWSSTTSLDAIILTSAGGKPYLHKARVLPIRAF